VPPEVGLGGRETPADVARFWLGNIPLMHCCTAERIAYRNKAKTRRRA
jgi:hypothetical protein